MLPALSLVMLLSVIDVRGDGQCPAPSAVAAAQQSLGTSAAGASPGHVAELTELPEGLRLSLRSPSGELLASREVQTRAECSQRATAVAVVLAAWEAELSSGQQQAPVLPPLPSWNWRVGAEAALGLTDHAGLRLLPTGALVGQLWLGASRWGWLGRLGASWPARSPIASAEVVWMRPLVSVEAGPWLQVAQAGGPVQVEVTAGIAVLRVWGEGFQLDQASTGLDLSVSPGVRWLLGDGPWRPELSLGATFWLIPQEIRVGGSSQARVLPQWEISAAAGFLWGR